MNPPPPRRSPPEGRRQSWLRAGVPLVLGAVLIAVFVLLLALREPGQAVKPEAAPPAAVVKSEPVDVEAREEPEPTPEGEIERPAGPLPAGLGRWGLEKPPPGWDPELASRLADFFARMYSGDPSNIDPNLMELREELRQFLKSLGPEAIPTLNAVLRAEPDFSNRRFLLYALGELGPRAEEATFALKEFYEGRRALHGARSETNHIIRAMGLLKNDTAYVAITEFVDEPFTSPYDRDKFIQALGEHPRREESIKRFIDHGRDDPDISTRNHSWQALGKLGSKGRECLGDLIAACEREPILQVRQTLLGSIGKIGDPAALNFLEHRARTAEAGGERLSAASAIRRIGTPRAMRVFHAVVAAEREDNLRSIMQRWVKGG